MRIRSVRHEDRLTLVEHLDELRTRIVVSALALAAAFALCFWQNDLLFDLLNDPLPAGRRPLTLGVTEPFLTTATVAAYAAIVLALPVILQQVYAFVLPAFTERERRAVLPLLLLVPLLFFGGVAFGYAVVLPRAVHFLLNFNRDQFSVQIRARDYYSFVALALAGFGLVFQLPVAIVAVTRLGITTPRRLRRSRRWAIVVIAVAAMVLSPGPDPVTMLLLMVPLLVLWELSILLAGLAGRPPPERVDGVPAAERPG
jgi:sec-independent protein translocase protein TatC